MCAIFVGHDSTGVGKQWGLEGLPSQTQTNVSPVECACERVTELYMVHPVQESCLHQKLQVSSPSSVFRWPEEWSTSVARPLSTETWQPGTSSSLTPKPARSLYTYTLSCDL